MISDPKISLVMPTYNQSRYLPEALDGIFAQTFKDFELIVVNDGSTDVTDEILLDYQQRFGFQVIEQSNQGIAASLNKGFRNTRGEYLTWTSSDNIMLTHMLEMLSSVLDQKPSIGLVYADWFLIDENGETLAKVCAPDYHSLLLLRRNFVNACFLYRRECYTKTGEYNPELRNAEDWDYWVRISRKFKLFHLAEPLYKYRTHPDNLSTLIRQEGTVGLWYRRAADSWKKQDPLSWHLSKLYYRWWRFKNRKVAFVDYEISIENNSDGSSE